VAALEFAVVAGALVTLILGSFGVGLLVWTNSGLQVTAALTARCYALGSSCTSNPQSYAVGIAGSWIGSNTITASEVTTTASSGCNGASGTTFARVSITAPSWVAALFPTSTLPASITVSACFPTISSSS
jgi:TadE-like protein